MSASGNMRPRAPVNDAKHNGLGDAETRCQFHRAGFTRSISPTNLSNVLLDQFGAWVVRALVGLGVLLIKAAQSSLLFFLHLGCICFMPRFAAASTFRHGVPPIILSSAEVPTSTPFGFAISNVEGLVGRHKVCWVHARRVVAGMAAHRIGLFLVLQEISDSMREKSHYPPINLKSESPIPLTRAAEPQPTIHIRSVPRKAVYSAPEQCGARGIHRGYISQGLRHGMSTITSLGGFKT